MTAGLDFDPVEREAIAAQVNLSVLRRSDPSVTSILVSASHVALYQLGENNKWHRREIEGGLFLVERHPTATRVAHRLVIVNRKNPDNYEDDLVKGNNDLELSDQMLMYQNSSDQVIGIWFYEKPEAIRVHHLLRSILSGTHPLPTKRKDDNQNNTTFSSPTVTTVPPNNSLERFFPNLKLTDPITAVKTPPGAQELGAVESEAVVIDHASLPNNEVTPFKPTAEIDAAIVTASETPASDHVVGKLINAANIALVSSSQPSRSSASAKHTKNEQPTQPANPVPVQKGIHPRPVNVNTPQKQIHKPNPNPNPNSNSNSNPNPKWPAHQKQGRRRPSPQPNTNSKRKPPYHHDSHQQAANLNPVGKQPPRPAATANPTHSVKPATSANPPHRGTSYPHQAGNPHRKSAHKDPTNPKPIHKMHSLRPNHTHKNTHRNPPVKLTDLAISAPIKPEGVNDPGSVSARVEAAPRTLPSATATATATITTTSAATTPPTTLTPAVLPMPPTHHPAAESDEDKMRRLHPRMTQGPVIHTQAMHAHAIRSQSMLNAGLRSRAVHSQPLPPHTLYSQSNASTHPAQPIHPQAVRAPQNMGSQPAPSQATPSQPAARSGNVISPPAVRAQSVYAAAMHSQGQNMQAQNMGAGNMGESQYRDMHGFSGRGNGEMAGAPNGMMGHGMGSAMGSGMNMGAAARHFAGGAVHPQMANPQINNPQMAAMMMHSPMHYQMFMQQQQYLANVQQMQAQGMSATAQHYGQGGNEKGDDVGIGIGRGIAGAGREGVIGNGGAKLTREEFRGVIQRMLTDRKLFDYVHEHYLETWK